MSQPVEVYPNTVIRQPESPHSSGSFGPVFIVLAVIVVISAVACVLGRLCNRRHQRVKEVHHRPSHRVREVNPHHDHPMDNKPSHDRAMDSKPIHDRAMDNKPSHDLGPKQWESRVQPSFKIRERGDVEFGFDRRIPSNGGGLVAPPPYRPEVRFADNV